MKIVQLHASNIKRIGVVDITPRSALVKVTGANGSGKSSVLDSIAWAIGGAKGISTQPIRQGHERAIIRLDLGDVVVTRTFTAIGTEVLVTAESGARFPSPQRMLDDLFDTLSFDPLEFSRMKPAHQLEKLRELVKLDVDIDALNQLNERDYHLRTGWNSKKESLQHRRDMLAEEIDPSIDVTPIDISALIDQLQAAGEHNAKRERELSRRVEQKSQLADGRSRVGDLRARAAKLLADAELLEKQCNELDATMGSQAPVPDSIDTTELRREIDIARGTNTARERQADRRAHHAMIVTELREAIEQSERLTQQRDERTRQKQAAIAAAQMPVDGLSFGNREVLYNGLPLEQASSAEQLRISVAIAMAANPKLRVLRIKDGSLLDDDSLDLLAGMAAENDYQVWIECVSKDAGVGIHMVDGVVQAIDGELVEAR